MKNRICRIATFVVLWALSIWYEPIFGRESGVLLKKQNGFFDKNELFPLHVGLKSWVKGTSNLLTFFKALDLNCFQALDSKRVFIGVEATIGPIIEWQPLNGMGIQTGLLYSYNYLGIGYCYLPEDKSAALGSIYSPSSARHEKGFYCAVGLVKLHMLSFPLSFRLYPEKTRQLVFYGGPRFRIAFPSAKRRQYYIDIPNDLDGDYVEQQVNASWKSIGTGDLRSLTRLVKKLINPFVKYGTEDRLVNVQGGRFSCVWDIGFEFNGRSGFIIGINGLGLVLGYDFTKLLFKRAIK